MRILVVSSIFHPNRIGGAEAVALLLARELSARGHGVDVLASTGRRGGPPGLAERAVDGVSGVVREAPSVGLYDLLESNRPQPGLPTRAIHHALQAHSPHWERLAGEALRRAPPDVVHTHNIVGLTTAVWRAARSAGVPIVHTLHDYHLLCSRTTLLRRDGTSCVAPPWPCRLLARAKLAPADAVSVLTAPSRFTLERHLAAGAFPRARHLVVPNAPEPVPADRPAREPAAANHGLFLGQLQAHKGVRELLTAVMTLAAGRPEFRFALAGEGPLRGEVERFCAGQAGACRYLGRIDGAQREAAFAEAGFLVLPSLWPEVAGLVLVEAAARGLPVITTARGGCGEYVTNGETGQIVEPEPGALAAAMARYLDDPELARRHGQAGARRAAAWTRTHQVEAFLAIYSELTGMPPR